VKLNTRNIVWVFLGILFALGSLWIHYQIKVEMPRGGSPDPGQFQVGNEAPDFSAPDLRGREVVLSELQGHKVVVLDFWATWCGPCLRAMPDLEEVHREFAERGVVVVALNLGEDPERARSFIKRQGYTFRVVADQDRAIAERFGVRAIPTLVVVGTDGRIAWTRVGYEPNEARELRALLDQLTEERPSSGSAAS